MKLAYDEIDRLYVRICAAGINAFLIKYERKNGGWIHLLIILISPQVSQEFPLNVEDITVFICCAVSILILCTAP